MKLISLFSGIGGFELAAEWMGWQTALSCEINPFSRKVLEYYWPDAYHHDDIHTLNIDKINEELSKRYGANWADDDLILTGGFPCQPYSTAGKRLGKADERHLFPEMLRIIREVRPRYIVGENVRGLVSWSGGLVFEEVCADLEAEGYDVQPFILPACAVNAPHRRERVWFIAHANFDNDGRTSRQDASAKREERLQERDEVREFIESGKILGDASDASSGRISRYRGSGQKRQFQTNESDSNNSKGQSAMDWENFPTQPPICGGDDGLPSELVAITFPKWRNESIKAYGNAIVPQVALEIFKTIENYIAQSKKNCSFEK
jgi:DNA (cytosine-5)-methyltransferase 1